MGKEQLTPTVVIWYNGEDGLQRESEVIGYCLSEDDAERVCNKFTKWLGKTLDTLRMAKNEKQYESILAIIPGPKTYPAKRNWRSDIQRHPDMNLDTVRLLKISP
ncbi:MAG: hypothetical protein ACRDBG_10015 [Waterburya sp.]